CFGYTFSMDFHTLAQHILARYVARAEEAATLNLTLAFDLKGHSTIGQCRQEKRGHYRIRLHRELCEHYGQTYLEDVIPHELAHALVMERFGRKAKPHGIQWKSMLRHLEGRTISSKERPRYPLLKAKSRRISRYMYRCPCQKLHALSAIRHNRIVRKTHVYACLTCKGVLLPVEH
ncbi:MAG: SprT-like domain-containing protein, partial [Campylobacterales bacterium]|nr:SprT-like domain-containing protein [Campylobacterales bacterium]